MILLFLDPFAVIATFASQGVTSAINFVLFLWREQLQAADLGYFFFLKEKDILIVPVLFGLLPLRVD